MDRREVERIKTVPTPVDLVEMTASVLIMAFGVIITVRSLQGVSPVSSLIYVMSEASGLTLGTMTFIVYLVFVLVQCAVYRDRRMTVRVFSQLPYTVLYSVCMDLFDYVLASLGAETLAGQWGLVLAGCLLTSLAIAMEADANVSMLPDDGLMLAVHRATGIPLGRSIIVVNVVSVILAFVLSLALLRGLHGVGLGTVFMMVAQGYVVKAQRRCSRRYGATDTWIEKEWSRGRGSNPRLRICSPPHSHCGTSTHGSRLFEPIYSLSWSAQVPDFEIWHPD